MTSEDQAITDGTELYPRMYETVERFVSKFTNNRLHIREQGQSLERKNPFDGRKTNLTTLIGYLVNEYVRFTDLVQTLSNRLSSDPDSYLSMYEDTRTKRLTTAMHLSQEIAFAYAFNLVDEGTDEEFDELRKKNTELTQDIVDLRLKLETCQKNYEGLKKRVSWDEHKDKKGELGDVSA